MVEAAVTSAAPAFEAPDEVGEAVDVSDLLAGADDAGGSGTAADAVRSTPILPVAE